MRLPLPARPHGPQMRMPTNITHRGGMVVHKGTDIAAPGAWSNFWGASYDWPWQQIGLDRLAGLRGTSAKVSPPKAALIAGGTTSRTARDRLHKWCEYAANHGLSIYWSIGWDQPDEIGLSTSQRVAASVALAEITQDYPTVGLDIHNEADVIGLTEISALVAYWNTAAPALREVTDLPLTISLGVGSVTDWPNSTYVAALASLVDFWDFHIYPGAGEVVLPSLPDDLVGWRASPHYKPWLVGEAGAPLLDSDQWQGGVSWQQTVYENLAQLSREPDCRGIYAFCLTDYDAMQFGMYDAGLPSDNPYIERTYITDRFRTWRGVR